MRSRKLAAAAMGLAILVAGFAVCGDGNTSEDSTSTPTGATPAPGGVELAITTSDLAVGMQRLAFVILEDGEPATDETVYVQFYKIAADGTSRVVGGGPIPYAPLLPEEAQEEGHEDHEDEIEIAGVYYVNIEFDVAGQWGLGVTRAEVPDAQKEIRVLLQIAAENSAPSIGEPAVAAKTLTLADKPIEAIDTSPEPDEEFHRLSVDEAISNGKPTVIAFATPSFCRTRTCGPMMDVFAQAAALSSEFDINWIHVEPYELDDEGDIVIDSHGDFTTIDAVDAWGMQTEPFLFVVDGNGIVVGRFEGPTTLEEIASALNTALAQ